MLKLANTYLMKMLECTEEMKILLLDKSTTTLVSLLYTMQQVIEKDVFLLQSIENQREFMPFMKCIIFVHPSSLDHVLRELKDPRYSEYYLFFSDMLTLEKVEKIAESDVQEVVKRIEVKEKNYFFILINFLKFFFFFCLIILVCFVFFFYNYLLQLSCLVIFFFSIHFFLFVFILFSFLFVILIIIICFLFVLFILFYFISIF